MSAQRVCRKCSADRSSLCRSLRATPSLGCWAGRASGGLRIDTPFVGTFLLYSLGVRFPDGNTAWIVTDIAGADPSADVLRTTGKVGERFPSGGEIFVACTGDLYTSPGCRCSDSSSPVTASTMVVEPGTVFWEDAAHLSRSVGGPESIECRSQFGWASGRYLTVEKTMEPFPESMAICEVTVWGVRSDEVQLVAVDEPPRDVGCVARAQSDCEKLGGVFAPAASSCYHLSPVPDTGTMESFCEETYSDGRPVAVGTADDHEAMTALAATTPTPIPIRVDRVDSVQHGGTAEDVVIAHTSFEEVPLDNVRYVGTHGCEAWRTELWRRPSTLGPAHAIGCQSAPLRVESAGGIADLAGRADNIAMRFTSAVVFGGVGMSVGPAYRFSIRTVSALSGSTRLWIDGEPQLLSGGEPLESGAVIAATCSGADDGTGTGTPCVLADDSSACAVEGGDCEFIPERPGVPPGWVVVLKTGSEPSTGDAVCPSIAIENCREDLSYASIHWESTTTVLNADSPRYEIGNAKYPEYNSVAFNAVMGCVGDLGNCLPPHDLGEPVDNAASLFGDGFRGEGVDKQDFLSAFKPPIKSDGQPGHNARCDPVQPGFATECPGGPRARWGFCNFDNAGCPDPTTNPSAVGAIGFGLEGLGAGYTENFGSPLSATAAWILVRPVRPVPGCAFRDGVGVGKAELSLSPTASAAECAQLAYRSAEGARGATWIAGSNSSSLGQCIAVIGMGGRAASNDGARSCYFHGPAREEHVDAIVRDGPHTLRLEVGFGDAVYDAGAQLTWTPVALPDAIETPGWPAELDSPGFAAMGTAETAAWGLRAQTALYTACTGGREELGFHASISGIAAGVVGVLSPEWSASGMSAAHGAQFYTFVSGAGPAIRHVDVGPVNVTGYGNIRVSVWARIEMPEDDQARVFASFSTAGATSYMLDVDAGTIGATADTWTEYSETIAPNAELVTAQFGAAWAQSSMGSASFDHFRITGNGPRRLVGQGCVYSDANGLDPALLAGSRPLMACEIPRDKPACAARSELANDVQVDSYFAQPYLGAAVQQADIHCEANADVFGAAFRHYRVSFSTNACINSVRLLDQAGAAVFAGEPGWQITVSSTARGDSHDAFSRHRWLCAPAASCSNGTEARMDGGAWIQMAMPESLWPVYVSDYDVSTNAVASIRLEGSLDGEHWLDLDARDGVAPHMAIPTPLLSVDVGQAAGETQIGGSASSAARLLGEQPTVVTGPFGQEDGLFFHRSSALVVADSCEYTKRRLQCRADSDESGSDHCDATGAVSPSADSPCTSSPTAGGGECVNLFDCDRNSAWRAQDEIWASKYAHNGQLLDPNDPVWVNVDFGELRAINGFYVFWEGGSHKQDRPTSIRQLHLVFDGDRVQRLTVSGRAPATATQRPLRWHSSAISLDWSPSMYPLDEAVETSAVRIELAEISGRPKQQSWASAQRVSSLGIRELGFVYDPQLDDLGREERNLSLEQCAAACDDQIGCKSFHFGDYAECPDASAAGLRSAACFSLHANVTNDLAVWLPFAADRHDRGPNRLSVELHQPSEARVEPHFVPVPWRPPYRGMFFDGDTWLSLRDSPGLTHDSGDDYGGCMAAWIYVDAGLARQVTQIIATTTTTGVHSDPVSLAMAVTPAGLLTCSTWGSSGLSELAGMPADGRMAVRRGVWTHVACSYASDGVVLYVDGREDARTSDAIFDTSAPPPDDEGTFIGGGPWLANFTGDTAATVAPVGDPCAGGATVHLPTVLSSAEIRITGGYDRNMQCSWDVQCDSGTADFIVNSLDTESNHDFVAVNGQQWSGPFGGVEVDVGTSATSLEFSSDGSVSGDGFSVTAVCDYGRLTAFAGAIGDVRLYNRSLTAQDVQALYAETSHSHTTPANASRAAVAGTVCQLKTSAVGALGRPQPVGACPPRDRALAVYNRPETCERTPGVWAGEEWTLDAFVRGPTVPALHSHVLLDGGSKLSALTPRNVSSPSPPAAPDLRDWTVVLKAAGDGSALHYGSPYWGDNSSGLNADSPVTDPGDALYDSFDAKRFDAVMLCVQEPGTSLDVDNCFAPVRLTQTVRDARSLFAGPERLVSERDGDEMLRAFGLSNTCPNYRSGFNIACTDGSSARWGFCAPSPSEACRRQMNAGDASAPIAGIGVRSGGNRAGAGWSPALQDGQLGSPLNSKQAWVLVRELDDPWQRVHIVSRRHRVDLFQNGAKVQALTDASQLPAREVISAIGNSRRMDSGWGGLSRLRVYRDAWSDDDIMSSANECSHSKAEVALPEDGSCTTETLQTDFSTSGGASSFTRIPDQEVQTVAMATGEISMLEDPQAAGFRVGDYVDFVGDSCAVRGARYKLSGVSDTSLTVGALAGPSSDFASCDVRRAAAIRSGFPGSAGAIDFPVVVPDAGMIVRSVHFTFGYAITNIVSVRGGGPSVVASLVAGDGREHVFYTSQILTQCKPQPGAQCVNEIVAVDRVIAGFTASAFHVRVRFVSNDVSLELVGEDGAPPRIEIQMCSGPRPLAAPWQVRREDGQHSDSGGMSIVEVEAAAGRAVSLKNGYFTQNITQLLNRWTANPASNNGVRMVPRGVGMYRLECTLDVRYTPKSESKTPLCRSSECAPGYTGDRCASCVSVRSSRFYRSNGLCAPCPKDTTMFLYILIGSSIFAFAFGVFVVRRLSKVKDLGLKLAPLLIWVAFLQTVGLLLDLDIEWPDAVRAVLELVSSINLNIEVMRPECFEGDGDGGGGWDFEKKMKMTMWVPLPIFAAVGLFYLYSVHLGKLHRLYSETSWVLKLIPVKKLKTKTSLWCKKKHGKLINFKPAPVDQVIDKMTSVLAGAFTVLSTAFVRTILSAFDCSKVVDPLDNSTDGVQYFLETEPDVECCGLPGTAFGWRECGDDGGGKYNSIKDAAVSGLTVYLVLLVAFVWALMTNNRHHRFDFVAAKMDQEWYWCECCRPSRCCSL